MNGRLSRYEGVFAMNHLFRWCSKCFHEPVCFQEASTVPYIVGHVCKSFVCIPVDVLQPTGAECERATLRPARIEGSPSPVMPLSQPVYADKVVSRDDFPGNDEASFAVNK